MAAIMIAVATQPPSHEYHLARSLVSARLLLSDNVETDSSASVVSLMVVSADNPPTRPANIRNRWHLRGGPQPRARLVTALARIRGEVIEGAKEREGA
jgi:hypothetical protein